MRFNRQNQFDTVFRTHRPARNDHTHDAGFAYKRAVRSAIKQG